MSEPSVEPLVFPERLVGRERESTHLLRQLHASRVHAVAITLIVGPTGSGKTAVVESIIPDIHRTGGTLAAAASSLGDVGFYTVLLRALCPPLKALLSGPPVDRARWRERVAAAAGLGVGALARHDPALAPLFPVALLERRVPAEHAESALTSMVVRMVGMFGRSSRPFVVFLDEFHLADVQTVALVAELACARLTGVMIVIAASDDPGSGNNVATLQRLLDERSERAEVLRLQPLGRDALSELISGAMQTSPSRCLQLAEGIWQQSAGNVREARRLLRDSVKQRALLSDASGWRWEISRVVPQASGRTRDGHLPPLTPAVRESLGIAALGGNTFSERFADEVFGRPIAPAVEAGIAAGVLVRNGAGDPRFASESIRAALVDALDDEARHLAHLALGRALLTRCHEPQVSHQIVGQAMRHFSSARNLLTAEERALLVPLAIRAGEADAGLSAFEQALAHFEFALELAGDTGWKSNRPQVLRATQGAATAALLLADELASARHLESLDQHAPRLSEQYDVRMTQLSQLERANRPLEEFDLLDGLLQKHGVAPTPRSLRPLQLTRNILRVAYGTWALGPSTELPTSRDPEIDAVHRTMVRLAGGQLKCFPLGGPEAVTRDVLHVLSNGVTNSGAMVVLGWGVVLTELGFWRRGNRVFEGAYRVLQQWAADGAEPVLPRGLFPVMVWPSWPIERALQAELDVGTQGSLSSTSLRLWAVEAYLRFAAGHDLADVIAEVRSGLDQSAPHGLLPAQILGELLNCLRELQGSGSADLDEILALCRSTSLAQPVLTFVLLVGWSRRGWPAVLDQISGEEPITHPLLHSACALSYNTLTVVAQYHGIRMGRVGSLRSWWVRYTRTRRLRKASHFVPSRRYRLRWIEAARHDSRGALDRAISIYEEALAGAEHANQRLDMAMISRDLADALKRAHREPEADAANLEAVESLRVWGALGAAAHLEKSLGIAALAPVSTPSDDSLLLAALEISEEVRFDRLLERVLRVVMERTHADRAAVLQVTEDEMLVVTATLKGGGDVWLASDAGKPNQHRLPLRIVEYVRETNQALLLARGAPSPVLDSNFSDPGHPSLLAAPITSAGHVRGVLLLLGSPDSESFQRQDLSAIRLLATQAAISLEQASLLSGMEKLVHDRTAQLERARVRAEFGSAAKSRFLANMSHELKTPLNAILGQSGLLANHAELDAQTQRAAKTIHESGHHLLGLINDVLEMSQLEARPLEIDRAPHELDQLLESAMLMVADHAKNKQLALLLEVHPGVVSTIHTDARRVRQVLLNLLGNAIKFTDAGQVVLRVRQERLPGVESRVRFEVLDDGSGIAPEHVERIFRPFEQAGNSAHRAAGTGLGLAISLRIVRALGGELRMENRLQGGARFWFDLPADEKADPLGDAVSTTSYAEEEHYERPDEAVVGRLRVLAERGNLRRIQEFADAYGPEHPEHAPLMRRVAALALVYDDSGILALLASL